jgi:trk system potassium uptake protein TrkH
MLPLATATGEWNNPIVALFTSTSAVCVTGLIVVDTGTYFSPLGQGIILLLIQVGGVGYMTATTLLLLIMGRRLGLKDRLAIQQSMEMVGLSGVRSLVISIISMTLIFEITGSLLLVPSFWQPEDSRHGLWLALFHSVSA